MPQTTTVVVANLKTLERYADQFEVECWSHPVSGSRVAGLFSKASASSGAIVGQASGFVQSSLMMFTGLTLGTTYYFRDRVHIVAGGPPSPWSAATGVTSGWVTEVAGDLVAPNPTYSPSSTLTVAGVVIKANPSGNSTDFDHFEFYYALNNGNTPSASFAPTIPRSSDAQLSLVIGDSDILSVWIRAVDTSGNQQAWQFLGGFASNGKQVSGSGLTGGAVVVDNSNFETSALVTPPPGWESFGNSPSIGYETVAPYSGSQSLSVTAVFVGQGGVATVRKYAVRPLIDAFRVSCQAKITSGSPGSGRLEIGFYSGGGGFISSAGAATTSTTYTLLSATAVAPTGSVYMKILCYASVQNTVAKFDEVQVARMQSAFEAAPVNTSAAPTTSGSALSQSGSTTTINVASKTFQYGDGTIVYSAGSVNPGSYNRWFVYADDLGFFGGAVSYVATLTESDVYANVARIYFGVITTVSGGGAIGGTGGGTGGGRGRLL